MEDCTPNGPRDDGLEELWERPCMAGDEPPYRGFLAEGRAVEMVVKALLLEHEQRLHRTIGGQTEAVCYSQSEGSNATTSLPVVLADGSRRPQLKVYDPSTQIDLSDPLNQLVLEETRGLESEVFFGGVSSIDFWLNHLAVRGMPASG